MVDLGRNDQGGQSLFSNKAQELAFQAAVEEKLAAERQKSQAITKEEIKLAKDRLKIADQTLRIQRDILSTDKGYISDLVAEKESKQKLIQVGREQIKVAVEAGRANREQLDSLVKQYDSIGNSIKYTADEMGEVWKNVARGKTSLSSFFKSFNSLGGVPATLDALVSSIGKFATPVAIATSALKAFNSIQATRRTYANVTGYGGEASSRMSFKDFLGYKKFELDAKGMGIQNPAETLYDVTSSGFGNRNIGFNKDERDRNYFLQLTKAATERQVVKTLYPGVSDKSFESLGINMTRNLGVKTYELSSEFAKLSAKVKDTHTGDFINMIAEMQPDLERFGVRIGSVADRVAMFDNALYRGIVKSQDIKAGYDSTRSSGMGGILGLASMAKQFGVDISGAGVKSGDSIGTQTSKYREYFLNHPEVSFQFAHKLARSAGETTYRGEYEFLRSNKIPIPGLETIYSDTLGWRDYESIIKSAMSPTSSGASIQNIIRNSEELKNKAKGVGIGTMGVGEGLGLLSSELQYKVLKGDANDYLNPVELVKQFADNIAQKMGNDTVSDSIKDGFKDVVVKVYVGGKELTGRVVAEGRNAMEKIDEMSKDEKYKKGMSPYLNQ